MIDTIEKIENTDVQYGKLNNRVYIMSLKNDNKDEVINAADRLCRQKKLDKIFLKAPNSLEPYLLENGFKVEARITNFFNNSIDCLFMGKYYSEKRSKENDRELYDNVLFTALNKNCSDCITTNSKYNIELLDESDINNITSLYKKVFDTYPFPIFDKDYIRQTMKNNVIYYGIKDGKKLVSIASAEVDLESLSAEMTDFATDVKYRGNGFAISILRKIEEKMTALKIFNLYTIARSKSYPMNITFKRAGYKYCGRLVNNTNISGSIESMNVWSKSLFNNV